MYWCIKAYPVYEAALSLVNKEGLSQLSMRRLADMLGIRAASLYWHVKDKVELKQLMADRIC
ncbi:MAG: TetR family transcriptional regulator [Bacillota bacterium]